MMTTTTREVFMPTEPTELSLRPHHKAYRSWTTDWYDDQGHRRTKRFGKERETTRKVARARFNNWKRNEFDAKAHVRNPDDPDAYTVGMLCDDYEKHAKSIYRKNGKPTSHMLQVAPALDALRKTFAAMPVQMVEAPAVARLRDDMIPSKDRHGNPVNLTAGTVNGRLRIIRQAFKWGRMYGKVPAATAYDVSIVGPVKPGRSAARASKDVTPVPEAVLAATLPHMPQTVADMVMVQYWTGMRSGELCTLKPCHIEVEGDVWFYRPTSHKTEHHGKERIVPIGPQAQKILGPYIQRRTFTEYVFLPEDAHRERLEQIGFADVMAYQLSRSTFKPGRCFRTETYRNKVNYAADRAFDPTGERRAKRDYSHRWTPHQLRHNAATRYREVAGLEAAQHVLGHEHAATSLRYAARSMETMREAARIAG